MVAIGRNMGSATMEDVYIAGEDGFFSEMIRLAGGENAYDRDDVRFPIVTAEGILRINPAAIIDMVTDLEEQGLTREDVVRQWQSVAQAQAVRSGRVHVLTGDYIVIPGPRFVRIVEDMAHAIHPDLQDLSSEHDRSAP